MSTLTIADRMPQTETLFHLPQKTQTRHTDVRSQADTLTLGRFCEPSVGPSRRPSYPSVSTQVSNKTLPPTSHPSSQPTCSPYWITKDRQTVIQSTGEEGGGHPLATI